MWHPLSSGLVVAGQRVETRIGTGCEHQPVVVELRSVSERYTACLAIDASRGLMHDDDPVTGDTIVAKQLGAHVAQPRDYLIAERARRKNRIGLDQSHIEPRIRPFQKARRRRTCETATNH